LAREFAFLIAEGARFDIGEAHRGQVMLFDLQAGLAFGPPYRKGFPVGVVLMGGAERMAVSAASFSAGDAWAWSATASLGLRGSVALGSIDLWAGVDGIVRSTTIETGEPGPAAIPAVSAVISVGGFLPALKSSSQASAVQSAKR
jgi:hypothetical protein